MIERTLAIIKPDAVKKRIVGKIIERIEEEGFRIAEIRMARLTKDDARGFYVVHKGKPFYEPLTDFMSTGEIVILALERENVRFLHREKHRSRLRCPPDSRMGNRPFL
jgi:nucleoside-diphosphate kinase